MQIYLLSIFSIVDDNLFQSQNLGTYYLYLMIMLTLIFYGFTAFKDPGFVTINDYQYTDSSNPYQKKRQQFHPLPGNFQLRTKEQVAEERIDLKVVESAKKNPKNKEDFEIVCEASIDEQNIPDNEIQNIENNDADNERTPKKSMTPSKGVSQSECPHSNNVPTSLVLSQGSTKPDINNNNANTQTDPQSHFQQEIIVEQIEHQQSPKSANNDKNIDQSVHHGNSMFIEKRYCPICNQDQIIRSKHCRRCNRCVALYDHHCPWTSNCVGERNRCVFYWFLLFQIQEIIYVMREAFPHLDFSQYSGAFSSIGNNINGVDGSELIFISFFVDLQEYDHLGIQELEKDFISQRFSIIVRITLQQWMEAKSETVLQIQCAQIDQLGIQQYIKSEFYKMNNQSFNQTQQQHQYEEIEQALQLQCDFVDKVVSNLTLVNKDLLNFQSQPQEQWQMEKNNYLKQIVDLRSHIDKIQSDYESEIVQMSERFQIAKNKLQEEHDMAIQMKDNQIIKLQQELKQLTKQKEELQSQIQQSNRKSSNDQTTLVNKLQSEKENNKLKDENKMLKIQLQQLQDQNAKLEETISKKHQSFQEQLSIKQKEINQMKELAQVILDQRTQIEDFFLESLQKLELGDDLQIKSLSQNAKIQILKEIIAAFTKKKH
ncbi:unnamed protein product (macronuclear) [Paramecium tetraurelia]|uniref:Palmitoyltransferase n=1 Tax=Paramecium tetraurelia TaxID=5888 RepID=A0E269_PARTE|nr:uncharacterized protein GSPATT00022558001 [Paramecium tetraurelia]CAK89386.1 unnamed protein product [Paramecium tetraurelia]|eukprot:XP_001456783.1 hypothetical protein (macronuclear) [Paramecium tetraurelia strain d4-2]